MMEFISVCSGIEAATVAFSPLGWKASAFCEIDAFPSALLSHHYPDITNWGDMSALPELIYEGKQPASDLLVGGTPCQSFSVAGERRSLADERGNLTLVFCEIANAIDAVRAKAKRPPSIILWENVPGVLNTKDNAFGCFLGELAGENEPLVPSGKKWTNSGFVRGPKRAIAWRILDAQYFGLAQRRRRVFVVASARDDICPAQILFEFEGLRRDTPPSRKTRQTDSCTARVGFTPTSFAQYQKGIGTLRASGRDLGGGSETLAVNASFAIPGTWIGRKAENGGNSTHFMKEVAPTQTAMDQHGVVSFTQNVRDEVRLIGGDGSIAGALSANEGIKQRTYLAFNSRQDPVSGDVFGSLDTCAPQAQSVVTWDSEFNARSEIMGTLIRGQQGGRTEGVAIIQALAKQALKELYLVQTEEFEVDQKSKTTTALLTHAYGCTPTRLNAQANALTASYGQGGVDLETKPLALITAIADDVTPKTSEEVAFTLSATDYKCPHQAIHKAISIQGSSIGRKPENGPQGSGYDASELCFTQTSTDQNAVAYVQVDSDAHLPLWVNMAVRRLTPVECERLQGFPDGYTQTPWRNRYVCSACHHEFTDRKASTPKDTHCPQCEVPTPIDYNPPDGHRYKALGNSMAVPVMRWIGKRIQHAIKAAEAASLSD